MTWTLPECEHETFTRNPLEVVICQLRFDPILKVHALVPEFQDRIRRRFPRYEEREGQLVELTPGGLSSRRVREHLFWARPETSTVVLGDQSLSLEYREHRSSDDLLADADLVFGALSDVFESVSPLRLGLRYVNVIDRERIERDFGRTLQWGDLLEAPFLQMPGGSALDEARFATELTRPAKEGAMTVRYGLLPAPGRSSPVFRLDIDRYTEQGMKVRDCHDLLESFAHDIYCLFMTATGPSLLSWMRQNA